MLEIFFVFIKQIVKRFFFVIWRILRFFLFASNEERKEKGTKGLIMSNAENIIAALLLAVLIRSFLYEPFHIPTGSMRPSLKEGDFIIVSKYDFGYSKYSFPFSFNIFNGRIFDSKKPSRGDVIVFRVPANPKINYIKRLIGLPGDRIQVINGIVYINDVAMSQLYLDEVAKDDNDKNGVVKEYEETLDNGKKYPILSESDYAAGDNTPVFVVPDDHYFFLGDNRDNSLDSRFEETGFIPRENIIGKAIIIFFSFRGNVLKFWQYNKTIHFDRIFRIIK